MKTQKTLKRKRKPNNDFIVWGGGTVYMLTPLTKKANKWVDEHLPEDYMMKWMMGASIAVEHRYICDIVDGMRADGLVWDAT